MKFQRMSVKGYSRITSYKMDTITITLNQLKEVIGAPFRYTDTHYPDDNDKTDVCFGVLNGKNKITIWNFKNGHYLGDECVLPEDTPIDLSVYYTNKDFFEEFKKEIGL